MDTSKLQALNEYLNNIIKRNKRNSRDDMFARRAHDALTTVFVNVYDGKWQIRHEATQEQIDRANKLAELGGTEVVYGRGRSLLQR